MRKTYKNGTSFLGQHDKFKELNSPFSFWIKVSKMFADLLSALRQPLVLQKLKYCTDICVGSRVQNFENFLTASWNLALAILAKNFSRGVLDASMLLMDVLVDPRGVTGATPDLAKKSTGFYVCFSPTIFRDFCLL